MDRDPRRTLVLAEIALTQIKALGLPADPPSYELWYSYAGAQNPELNEAINHFVGEGGSMSLADLDRIYDRFAARFGGEEFAIILPETSLPQARAVAENIRGAIMSREVRRRTTRESLGRVTVSIGVAQYEADENGSALIARADRHLSSAKAQGRNRVVWQSEPPNPLT